MDTYVNTANGKSSGEVGKLIGSKSRSAGTIKNFPASENNPTKEKQMAWRDRLALAVSFLQPIVEILSLACAL